MKRVPTAVSLPAFAAKPLGAVRRIPHLGAAVALTFFSLLATGVYLDGKPYFSWDLAVSRAVQSAPWPVGFGTLMRGVSLPGDDVPAASGLVIVTSLALLVFRARREAVVLGLVAAAGYTLKAFVKYGIGRPRPTSDLINLLSQPSDCSFPSGHTVHYVVFLGFLWFLTLILVRPRLLRWPLLGLLGALVLLVGLSRVYLGAHWASDVLGGYLLGGALLTIAIGGYRRWSRRAAAVNELTPCEEPAPFDLVAAPDLGLQQAIEPQPVR